ncbi:GGDEF domain-containing protein [Parahaliea maris]|uniref:diguanylate cyclase n=1 Tax=Parahaliea maris TaxID=2716870 RepID=A0A5C8ZR39_9GAMM|nr:GGDEF domain-containing protein [Parahaliea maris]TXS90199.1 GGDEF domain-containing protein [Parahaliea maris]
MDFILTENQAFPLYTLIFTLTSAQVLVLYCLSASNTPIQGLGLFTVYFMSALMGWILFALQQGQAAGGLGLDVAAVVTLITSYLLFLACGQRAGTQRGRWVLGALCLAACFSAFYFPPAEMFKVQLIGTALLWGAAGAVAAWRGWLTANAGDWLIAAAGLGLCSALAAMTLFPAGEPGVVPGRVLMCYTAAYVVVVIGFLGSVLLEYQQHLSQLAIRDPATQLFNRRGLEEALHLSLAAAARHNSRTSAVLVDIDDFPQLRQSFGSDFGDQVVRQLADLLQDLSRSSDVIARVGNETFLLILPNTAGDAARILAERIREAVADTFFRADRQRVAVSISAGIATQEGATTVEELSVSSGRALQVARRGGQNRVAAVDRKAQRFGTGTATDAG